MAKIKITVVHDEYDRAQKVGRSVEEKNDCSVVALSVATGVSYEEALKVLTANGRKPGRGTWHTTIHNSVKELGFRMEAVEADSFVQRYPAPHNNLRGVTSHHPRRFPAVWKDGCTYLCASVDHIWCVKDGQNVDWSINRVLRVKRIWRITKGA